MRKYYLFFTLCTLVAKFTANGQTESSDSVKAVINQMFAAMKNADAEALKGVFADSALLQSITRTQEGKTIVKNEPMHEFIDFIGKQPLGAADERIQFDAIKIDGPLASAWTPYKFYFNGQLHHCGVNSFQLVRIDGVWRIQYIIDTRKKDDCE